MTWEDALHREVIFSMNNKAAFGDLLAAGL